MNNTKWPKLHRNTRWKARDTIMLLERLELYVSSGLSIDKALLISGQGISSKQKKSIDDVRAKVISGSMLSRSLIQHIGLSKTLSSLIEHGESSGGLVRSLSMARTLLERQDELIKKCLSALAYPVIIGIFACILTFGLVRGVMPQIIPLLKSLHVQLPLITRFVIAISENVIAYGLYIILTIFAITILSISLYKNIYFIKKWTHIIIIYVPIVGSLIYLYSLSLFLQSCGALLESGLAIDVAYSDTVNVIAILSLKERMIQATPDIRRGISIGSLFQNSSRHIPAYISPLLLAGEASGTLGSSLIRASSIIDRDMDHALKRLTSLIEPVMMAGMGIVVGGIAVSIMMPIYDISKVLQH